jgi:hypothetical protein
MADNIDILVKLFETLKDSSNSTKDTTQKLIIQQLELVNYIKSLPIDDLKQALKEHSKESADDIDSCTETVKSKNDGVMEEIKKLSNKVRIMIIVVLVTFTILTGGYAIMRTAAESHPNHEIEQKTKMTQDDRNYIINEIVKKLKVKK